ncbi:MAG: hypothetical protein AAGE52_16250 [Myxococcota bacterium]
MRGSLWIALWVPLALGCPRPGPPRSDAQPREGNSSTTSLFSNHPAGASCAGRRDCAGDQVCVESRCRHRRTTVRGEVLAAAASAQRAGGDSRSALETYEQAMNAFEQAGAPVPPEVLCGAALTALAFRDSPPEQERGARSADLCFRGSLPGDPLREEVLRRVAALRYDGLSLAAFDENTPPDEFYSEEPSRPAADAVRVETTLSGASDQQGLTMVRETLTGDDARRAIAECFVQAWEQNHQRSARGSLLLKFTTRLRDMGAYEIYVGQIEVIKTDESDDGFEACSARTLSSLLEDGPRLSRPSIWQLPFDVNAELR